MLSFAGDLVSNSANVFKVACKVLCPEAQRHCIRQNTGLSRSPLSVAEMQADGWDNYLKPEEDSHAVRRMKKHYNRLKMFSGGPQRQHMNRKCTTKEYDCHSIKDKVFL